MRGMLTRGMKAKVVTTKSCAKGQGVTTTTTTKTITLGRAEDGMLTLIRSVSTGVVKPTAPPKKGKKKTTPPPPPPLYKEWGGTIAADEKTEPEVVAVTPVIPKLLVDSCPLCWLILLEPTTLPCSHSFCLACFQSHVEECGSHCPCCRRRTSIWCQRMENKMINEELWSRIKAEFPNEVEERLKNEAVPNAVNVTETEDEGRLDEATASNHVTGMTGNEDADYDDEDYQFSPSLLENCSPTVTQCLKLF